MQMRKRDYPTILGPAECAYDDWKGTACAETSVLVGSGDLYALAGLDDEPDRWTIVAVDIGAFSHGADPTWTVRVYAADRQDLGIHEFADFERVAGERGGIPVVEVLLHAVALTDVVKCMKTFEVQLRGAHLQHRLIHVADADHPEQD